MHRMHQMMYLRQFLTLKVLPYMTFVLKRLKRPNKYLLELRQTPLHFLWLSQDSNARNHQSIWLLIKNNSIDFSPKNLQSSSSELISSVLQWKTKTTSRT